MELDTIKYLVLNAHVSGSTKLWNTDLWKSYGYNAPVPTYNPIIYNMQITHANIFYKSMLLRRQRVLLLSSIEKDLKINGPFSHLFLTSIWIGGALTNYRVVKKNLRYFGVLLDILHYLESTQKIQLNISKLYIQVLPQYDSFNQLAVFNITLNRLSIFNLLNLSEIIEFDFMVKPTFINAYLIPFLYKSILIVQKNALKRLVCSTLFQNYFYQLSMIIIANKLKLLSQTQFSYSEIDLHTHQFIRQLLMSGISFFSDMHYNLNRFYSVIFKNKLLFRLHLTRNTLNLKHLFFKIPGAKRARVKQCFPSINIALDLRLANMYILNESRRLYIPLISFHKSSDPARGPVFTIPAHLATREQISSYGGYYLGLLMKSQLMDIKQFITWSNLLSWRN